MCTVQVSWSSCECGSRRLLGAGIMQPFIDQSTLNWPKVSASADTSSTKPSWHFSNLSYERKSDGNVKNSTNESPVYPIVRTTGCPCSRWPTPASWWRRHSKAPTFHGWASTTNWRNPALEFGEADNSQNSKSWSVITRDEQWTPQHSPFLSRSDLHYHSSSASAAGLF